MSKGSMTCNRKECLNMMGRENIFVLRTDFRAAVVQAIAGEGNNPKDSETEKQIENLEKLHASHLERTGICISGRNDIPGYKQVVLLGPDFVGTHVTDSIGMIAVTADGCLVTGLIKHVKPDEKKSISINQAMKALQTDQSDQKFVDDECLSLTLDKFENFKDRYGMPNIEFSIKKIFNSCILKQNIKNKIKTFNYQQLQDRLDPVRRAFADVLDETILHDMQENGLMTVEYGRLLTGGDGASKDAIKARQQAVRTYPLLSGLFLINHMFRDVIDARTSLSKAIANYFKTDNHRIKRLLNLTWQQTGLEPRPPDVAICIISEFLKLPDKVFPKNTKQFQQLEILRDFGIHVYGEDLFNFAERMSKNRNPWQLIDRIEQTSGANVRDAMHFLSRKLLVPAMFNKGIHAAVPPVYRHDESYDRIMNKKMDEIRACFKIGELLDWSDRYHRNIMRYEDRLDTVSSEQTWSGLLGAPDFGNGVIARELNSAQDLKAQGILEHHCVGGYLSRVLGGKDRNGEFMLVFSIEKNNMILSTAEIGCILKTDGNNGIPHLQVNVRQNRARGNEDPCEDAVRIVNQVVAKLESVTHEACRTYLDNLKHACLEYNHKSNIDIHVWWCGFDPFDHVMMERVWKELSPALPRQFRKDGLDALIAHGLSRATCEKPSSEMQSDPHDCVVHGWRPCVMQLFRCGIATEMET